MLAEDSEWDNPSHQVSQLEHQYTLSSQPCPSVNRHMGSQPRAHHLSYLLSLFFYAATTPSGGGRNLISRSSL